ncbi:recombinase family protein [Bacillus sp. WMMC1349]|uniref:recombinase family protein n=1 Tax=Bacillus sp. WMMC1349 TaxID=2736254 RepID=UPI0015529227|nr:recombinase family protein [Bacillus sp. WMMC1349]NPC90984.1 recombinase family protein [Bacillus sp. WMMC1349]NPC94968.1 recombinase family protein [Bacillus sp. WMMC1349]NPC95044.1 recombinase family protein [Bacillus sp. WMMC1349]NPC95078.1 recombinase family protein [Bacillus sp. WMMC1349]NPC95112.1 recombinase family protein [Bacillus sp. WMMC1349]
MKCVIYTRVSTDLQAEEGISLDLQKERLEQYALSQGWEIKEVYTDEGFSAKNTERPAFQKMLNDMKSKTFDIILVYRLDRFTRSVVDLYEILKQMDRYNVKFKSSMEIFDTTTATGRMFITLVATLAQWERETISERVKDAMKKRAEEGKFNGGKVPYGYRLKNGELVTHKEEAKLVKLIFERSISLGAGALSRYLNKNGFRTRSGSLFQRAGILSIINNPIYIGKIRWGEEVYTDIAQKSFEQIISLELWEQVHKSMDIRKKNNTKSYRKYTYLFSGVFKCARCGNPLMGSPKYRKDGSVRYGYKCKGHYSLGICDLPQFGQDSLEKTFLNLLKLTGFKDKLETDETKDDMGNIKKKVNELDAKKKRAKELYIEGDLTKKEYREMLENYSNMQSKLLQKIKTDSESVTLEELALFIENIQSEWVNLDDIEKKSAINAVFDYVKVDVKTFSKPSRYSQPAEIIITEYKLN